MRRVIIVGHPARDWQRRNTYNGYNPRRRAIRPDPPSLSRDGLFGAAVPLQTGPSRQAVQAAYARYARLEADYTSAASKANQLFPDLWEARKQFIAKRDAFHEAGGSTQAEWILNPHRRLEVARDRWR